LYSATNLEKDTATTYAYDRNGNLVTRVDGGVTTTMTYDARDRITSKTYSGSTPAVYYCYDGTQSGNCTGAPTGAGKYLYGRLAMVRSNGTDARYEQYDALGRVLAHTQVTDSVSYPFTYQYHLADGVTLMHYPSGRDVFTTYNGAGRPEGVTGYASSIAYAAFGGVTNLALANGVTETTQYDSRLRMSSLAAQTGVSPNQTTLLGLNYTYYNNSNVAAQQITGLGLVANQSYGYDDVNRLTSASEDNTVWSRVFGYDPWGNGWVETGSGVAIDPFTPRNGSWFNGQNRLVNAGLNINYSSSGNQTAIGAYTFQYDGENRLTSATVNSTSVTYAYDGEGRRVKRTTTNGTTVYVYNALGELAAEYGGETTGGGLQYLTADALGSTRLVTNASAGAVCRLDYLPFGEEIPAGVGGRSASWNDCSGLRLKFTGKERGDAGSENSLDYFIARYYSGAQGRFISPDWAEQPEAVPYADFRDPQTLNLYAYTRNNPLTLTDPDGHCGPWCIVGGMALGAAGSYISQRIANPDNPVNWAAVGAGALGGAVAGATMGFATTPAAFTSVLAGATVEVKAGVAVQLAAAAISGVSGGVVSRAVESGGDPNKTIGTPSQIATDAGMSLLGKATGMAVAPLVKATTTAGRAVAVGEAKIARGTKPSPSLPNRQAQLGSQQQVTGAVAGAAIKTALKAKEGERRNCTSYGDCP
ncbi:MAG: RHS repeat-associated core domain-containing protein, partial [Acidobacteria bacterium]|nr:RHS repeat-associated core domain-containing protein [Acidobacteriota bacterium]